MLTFFIGKTQHYSIQQVPFSNVKIDDPFWSPRLKANINSLNTCIAHTQDSVAINGMAENSGIFTIGDRKWTYPINPEVYKSMEGIAYSLINNPDEEYEILMDRWSNWIATLQEPDGYLSPWAMIPEGKTNFMGRDFTPWTDMSMHEMYFGGHMIEAAVAYYRATGKDELLKVGIKFANHLMDNFGPGKRHWVAGHQEIELALVKLYHVTSDKKYLDYANWLLDERGNGYGKGFIWEDSHFDGPAYCQDNIPVTDITDINGHAVRAMYMFTGMADVAAEKDLPEYVNALERVWEDVVYRNMYITGGIGSSRKNEGFTKDYDLPNKSAYCETCASIGMVLWNNRMNLFSKDAKYIDVMERSLYNGVLTGVALDGKTFFYVNPLESEGDHHRQPWYDCACCPPNVSRLIPSVGSYIYAANNEEIFVNLYLNNEASIDVGNNQITLKQSTGYPWDGKIEIYVQAETKSDFDLNLRIPGWCGEFEVAVGGKEISRPILENGYVKVKRTWADNEKVILDLSMPVKIVASDPKVEANIGKRAIQRGPLVYCVEEIDNKMNNWDDITISSENKFTISPGKEELDGMRILETESEGQTLTFVPYFAWDNRTPGKMKVWIDYDE